MDESTSAPAPEQNDSPAAVELTIKEIIKRMMTLQEKDKELLRFKADMVKAQAAAQEIRLGIEEEKKAIEFTKERRKKLLLDHKTLEGDVAKIDGDINKHTGELRMVKTNDAYKALLTEIENLKKKKDDTETKILELMDQLDTEQKREKEALSSIESHKKDKEDQAVKFDQEKKKLEALFDQESKERALLLGTLPQDAADRYERISSKREGVAIVPILDGASCGGCRMHLTPQMINNVIKAHEFIQCERCQRILYMPPQPTV